ncbi:hypothetical protein JCM3775_000601 [Rhodotorula graminis]
MLLNGSPGQEQRALERFPGPLYCSRTARGRLGTSSSLVRRARSLYGHDTRTLCMYNALHECTAMFEFVYKVEKEIEKEAEKP